MGLFGGGVLFHINSDEGGGEIKSLYVILRFIRKLTILAGKYSPNFNIPFFDYNY